MKRSVYNLIFQDIAVRFKLFFLSTSPSYSRALRYENERQKAHNHFSFRLRWPDGELKCGPETSEDALFYCALVFFPFANRARRVRV